MPNHMSSQDTQEWQGSGHRCPSLLTHSLESWVIVNQSPAMTVAFAVKIQLGHVRLVNGRSYVLSFLLWPVEVQLGHFRVVIGCFGLRTIHSLNDVDYLKYMVSESLPESARNIGIVNEKNEKKQKFFCEKTEKFFFYP